MHTFLNDNSIYFQDDNFIVLNDFIENSKCSKAFILVDENSEKYCLDILLKHLNFDVVMIRIKSGEIYKNLDTCQYIWEQLSENGADRKSLLINLGGGVVTDIGGFVASCFRRGISFIHIPTTLLAMVDAAIGGKNGVDLGHLKNQIGVINQPELILVNDKFLDTLPQKEILSGFAEVIKHGLITDEDYLNQCLKVNFNEMASIISIIEKSMAIKLDVVLKDSKEMGLRKALNYGHTLGHAVETFRMGLSPDKHLLHGEAIAIGLVLETYISYKLFHFPIVTLEILKAFVDKQYSKQYFSKEDQQKIINLLKYDKKNIGNDVNFVLLKKIGEPMLDCKVDIELILEAFDFYRS